MASVTFDHATRMYPKAERPAVDAFDLHIPAGEFIVLVGPSGCGKSTCLRMLAGLEPLDDGSVFIGDVDVSNLPPKERDVAMVFQSYALYPHLTVAENMGFALKIAGVPKHEIHERVAEAARLLDLEPLLNRKPAALSGGQRQRVATGRAIVRKPKVFLMDEPLSNLDAKLRVQTRTELSALQQRLGTTTVYVTHDQVEAMTMGNRVAVMYDGRLQQVDTPRNVYAKPANAFVAGFIGSPAMNLREVVLNEDGADVAGHTVVLPRTVIAAAAKEGATSVTLGVRPDMIEVVPAGADGAPATITVVEELGADAFLHAHIDAADLPDGPDLIIRVDPRTVPAKGAQVRLRIHTDELHVFSTATGERYE